MNTNRCYLDSLVAAGCNFAAAVDRNLLDIDCGRSSCCKHNSYCSVGHHCVVVDIPVAVVDTSVVAVLCFVDIDRFVDTGYGGMSCSDFHHSFVDDTPVAVDSWR